MSIVLVLMFTELRKETLSLRMTRNGGSLFVLLQSVFTPSAFRHWLLVGIGQTWETRSQMGRKSQI